MRHVLGLVVVASVATLFGCGGGGKDFSAEDFKTISQDMPEAKVVEILGKPKESLEALGAKRLFWESKGKYYSVSFQGGKVAEPLAHQGKEDYDMMIGLMHAAKQMGK